ncbi:MAG: hypothetical protein ABIP88_02925 [Candidatus Binatia bacterium]
MILNPHALLALFEQAQNKACRELKASATVYPRGQSKSLLRQHRWKIPITQMFDLRSEVLEKPRMNFPGLNFCEAVSP